MTAPLAFPMQNTTYGEEMLYRLIDDLFAAGVRDLAGLTVAQRAAGANMSVDVAAGEAVVAVSAGGKRVVRTTASTNSGTPGTPTTADNWTQTFLAADATNPRVDRVVLQVRDVDVDAANFSTRDVAWRVIPGTPTAGATLVNLNGVASIPVSSLLLANVLVPASATSVTTANIDTTVRSLAGAGGQGFQTYTPAWTALGTAPAIGNGTLTGRYQQIGKNVNGNIVLTAGTTTTFGTNAWLFSLPVTAAATTVGPVGLVSALDSSASQVYPGFFRISTTTTASLDTTSSPIGNFTNLVPVTWATADVIMIRFAYEAA